MGYRDDLIIDDGRNGVFRVNRTPEARFEVPGTDHPANFAVYRTRREVNVYVGQDRYRLVRDGESIKIGYRRAELDVETLDPHGTLSSIL
jgi:3-phenylpropionate/cinnamic acid dioxygenase small subunit